MAENGSTTAEASREYAKRTWDGHSSTAEQTASRAKKISVQQQIEELEKTQAALAGEESEPVGPSIGPSVGSGFRQASRNSVNQAGRILSPEHIIQSNVTSKTDIVPHVVISPSLLTQKVPSQKLEKWVHPIEPMSLEEKMKMYGGTDSVLATASGKCGDAFVAGEDVHKEAIYSGLTIGSNCKRARMTSALLDDTTFIKNYASSGEVFKYIVKCPEHEQWGLKGQDIELTMDIKDTVNKMKIKLAEVLGMPIPKMKLKFDGKFIKDNTTFAENNCIPNSVMHLSVKERGGKNKNK